MKHFLILHYGFVPPDEAAMAGWNAWFQKIAERQMARGHFTTGRELTAEGTAELPFGRDSITGYTLIRAESLDEAEAIAAECPIVDATRVYEIQGG